MSIKNKIFYCLPIFGILGLVLLLNFYQYPMTDEWDQISEPAVRMGPYYIISRYFTNVSRIGDIYARFFLYLFQNDIFLEQKVFGLANTLCFTVFLFVLYRLIRKTFRVQSREDLVFFCGLFAAVYLSGHFYQSYINQFGATTYFWTILNALCFLFPYYRLMTSPPERRFPFLNGRLLYVCLFGLLTGWGSELIGPVILLGLGGCFLYLIFIKKIPPPFWFYAGGLCLLTGWMLVFFGPGHRLRNAYNIQYYTPLLQRNLLDILRTTASWFGIYFAASLPLSIPSVIALRHIKKHSPDHTESFWSILVFLSLGLATALIFAFMLQWLLPPRAWIIFTFFFIIAAGFSLSYAIYEVAAVKKAGLVFTILLTLVGTLHLVELVRYRQKFTPIFVEIQNQKAQGIREIRIRATLYTVQDAFFLRWVDDFFIQGWVLDGVARYYGVDSIDFINPDTEKSFRL